MEWMIWASMAVAVLAAAAAVLRSVQCRDRETGTFVVRETRMTAVMGVLLLAVAFLVGFAKLYDPATAGGDATSYYLAAALILACGLLGSFTVMFGLLKRVTVYDDRLCARSAFGVSRELPWTDIVRVDKPMMSKALKLTDKDGKVLTVSGGTEDFERFLTFAQERISHASGAALLQQTENRLRGGKHL